jgi:hypothetical protein
MTILSALLDRERLGASCNQCRYLLNNLLLPVGQNYVNLWLIIFFIRALSAALIPSGGHYETNFVYSSPDHALRCAGFCRQV